MRASLLRSLAPLAVLFAVGSAALPSTASADRFTEIQTHITAAGMTEIAPNTDGTLWITSRSKGSLLAVQPDGQVAERPITGLGRTAHPWELASDGQGQLWSTDPIGPLLIRSDPSGASVDIPTGAPGTRPVDLATGADGNVWFTTNDQAQIGRVTPAGDLTYFPVTTRPDLITTGIGDTAAWLTNTGGDISRVALDGTTSTVATVSGKATGITQAPDGNVWVTTANSVNRVTPGGAVSTFTAGLPAAIEINDIAAAKDGTLWFSGLGGIGRVMPDGTITTFVTKNPKADAGAGALPSAIAIGPGGTPTYFGDNPDPAIGSVVGIVDPMGVPSGSAKAAEEVETKTAVLPASINPEAGTTSVSFEYGITMQLGKSSSTVSLDAGLTPQDVRIPLADLEPKRIYFYRVVASNRAGTLKGPVMQFTTKNIPLPTTPPLPGQPKPGDGGTGAKVNLLPVVPGASTLKLGSPAAKLGKKGIVKVKLACPAGAECSASVEVTAKLGKGKKAKSVVIAKKAVTVASGSSANVGLRISPSGQKAIRKAGRKGLATLAVFAVGQTKTRARLTLKR